MFWTITNLLNWRLLIIKDGKETNVVFDGLSVFLTKIQNFKNSQNKIIIEMISN